MNLEYTRIQIEEWKRLDALLDEQFNTLCYAAVPGKSYLMLTIEGPSIEGTAMETTHLEDLREAAFETGVIEITLEEREAVHKYVKSQINTLHRQLMDEVAAIIIPDTEEPA